MGEVAVFIAEVTWEQMSGYGCLAAHYYIGC